MADSMIITGHDLNPACAYELRDLFALEQKIKERKEFAINALLKAMEEHRVTKIENDLLAVTYIPETDREFFDTKAMRADLPEVYDDYVSMRPVKASVRVRIK